MKNIIALVLLCTFTGCAMEVADDVESIQQANETPPTVSVSVCLDWVDMDSDPAIPSDWQDMYVLDTPYKDTFTHCYPGVHVGFSYSGIPASTGRLPTLTGSDLCDNQTCEDYFTSDGTARNPQPFSIIGAYALPNGDPDPDVQPGLWAATSPTSDLGVELDGLDLVSPPRVILSDVNYFGGCGLFWSASYGYDVLCATEPPAGNDLPYPAFATNVINTNIRVLHKRVNEYARASLLSQPDEDARIIAAAATNYFLHGDHQLNAANYSAKVVIDLSDASINCTSGARTKYPVDASGSACVVVIEPDPALQDADCRWDLSDGDFC